jgi:hypothetical protein
MLDDAEMPALGARSGDSGADALDDDRAFELTENAQHLEQRAPGRGGRVDSLLVQIEIAADGAELAE